MKGKEKERHGETKSDEQGPHFIFQSSFYPDNHDGVITDLESDILECEVKWALESNRPCFLEPAFQRGCKPVSVCLHV